MAAIFDDAAIGKAVANSEGTMGDQPKAHLAAAGVATQGEGDPGWHLGKQVGLHGPNGYYRGRIGDLRQRAGEIVAPFKAATDLPRNELLARRKARREIVLGKACHPVLENGNTGILHGALGEGRSHDPGFGPVASPHQSWLPMMA